MVNTMDHFKQLADLFNPASTLKGYFPKQGSHFNPKPESLAGICPECGSKVVRESLIQRRSFVQYDSKDDLAYGAWECINGHSFHVVPERVKFGEPKGTKITK